MNVQAIDEFKNLFEKQYANLKINQGEVVDGTVVSVVRDFAVVNIGFKSEGYVVLEEFRNLDGEIQVAAGDKFRVLVEELEDKNGNVILSKEKADAVEAWSNVEKIFETNATIEGMVVNKVKGGLSVNLGGIKAFLPGSQIDLKPVKSLDKLIGKKFSFKILKLNQAKGNIVLSRRAILETERQNLRRDVLENIKEGQIIRGAVKNITDYGVFIDLGGIDGLLHITDLTWGRVNHPNEILKIGDEIDVVVLKYDEKSEKVSLGLKQLTEDPWTLVDNEFAVGQKIKGKVVSITDYGVFVEVKPGIEALIHVSELSWTKKIKHPSKLVKMGDELESVILDLDIGNKKIALGLKQLEPNPWDILNQKYPIGSVVKGKIRNITDFGIFVGVDEDSVDGLVHVSDISWDKDYKWPNEDFVKGQEVECVVLNIDKENKKFALGLKQLSDDPFAIMMRNYPLGREVIGKVEKIEDKGVVIRIEENVFAYLPNNETGVGRAEIKSRFTEGGEVSAQVKKYDDRDRKMIVSVKNLNKKLEKENMKDFLDRQGDAKVKLFDIMKKDPE
ncbi:MAG: 30S ribosomal protein S1 [Deltaproteobacteria bacterium]|nr:30S ribosomal protein S1 [Deltaproteobacteria bacterium]